MKLHFVPSTIYNRSCSSCQPNFSTLFDLIEESVLSFINLYQIRTNQYLLEKNSNITVFKEVIIGSILNDIDLDPSNDEERGHSKQIIIKHLHSLKVFFITTEK